MTTTIDKYLRILDEGANDVLASLETGNPKDFYAALERHKTLTESVKNGVEAFDSIFFHDSQDSRQADV